MKHSSRLGLLARMDDATAASALAGLTVKLNSINALMRQSPTYDQSKEMSRYQQLALNISVRVYFRDLHSPCQRATLREHARTAALAPAQGHGAERLQPRRTR